MITKMTSIEIESVERRAQLLRTLEIDVEMSREMIRSIGMIEENQGERDLLKSTRMRMMLIGEINKEEKGSFTVILEIMKERLTIEKISIDVEAHQRDLIRRQSPVEAKGRAGDHLRLQALA